MDKEAIGQGWTRGRENPGDLSCRAEQGAHISSVSSHQLLPPRIVNYEGRVQVNRVSGNELV